METEEQEFNDLVLCLFEEAEQRGHNSRDLAKVLGISYMYMRKLATGKRPFNKAGREVLVKAAAYLNVPVIQVYVWADVLSQRDFMFHTQPKAVADGQSVLDAMRADPRVGGLAPARDVWVTLDIQSRNLLEKLYLADLDKRLTEKSVSKV